MEQYDQISETKKKLEDEKRNEEFRADEAERSLKTLQQQYNQLEGGI